jgi:hypothetical protein
VTALLPDYNPSIASKGGNEALKGQTGHLHRDNSTNSAVSDRALSSSMGSR